MNGEVLRSEFVMRMKYRDELNNGQMRILASLLKVNVLLLDTDERAERMQLIRHDLDVYNDLYWYPPQRRWVGVLACARVPVRFVGAPHFTFVCDIHLQYLGG